MRPIVYPVRVGFNSLCVKDETGRVIIPSPIAVHGGFLDCADFEQREKDLDEIVAVLNRANEENLK